VVVVTGDLWAGPANAWRVVPTNRMTRRDGSAVMGAGIALQATERFPELPRAYGAALRGGCIGLWTYAPGHVLCLPTKHDWRDNADIGLVARGLCALRYFAKAHPDAAIRLPMIGAGLGRLRGADVRSLIDRTIRDLPNVTLVLPRGYGTEARSVPEAAR
jgi:hypothetical protein